MINSKHFFLFARRFVAKGDTPPVEDDTAIVWASNVQTTQALSLLVNTLDGVKGYVANAQGLGVRVSKEHLAAARALLQSESTRLTPANRALVGRLRFIIKGLPLNTSAQQVISLLASNAVGQAKWAPWHAIPMKMIAVGRVCHWTVKADTEPPALRLILQNDFEVVIEKTDTPVELATKQKEAQLYSKI